ncbi:hypothetical protein H8K33_05285 [Undibacterium amnicola]|uniref:MSHA biogenesis protein MshJ n=1 Tax=Undibacterium amnicola TaxID=1834038 RepID=A0ABR6XN21_9BURK|nr:hypothetical protein [Undibacterium amnicola]MBC3830912.1 hypothetical protein [Undibacterium amnicola]
MKKIWLSFLRKIDILSMRERAILFVLCSVGVLMIGFTFLIEPQLKLQKTLKTQQHTHQMQMGVLQEELAQLSGAMRGDPDAEIKARLNEAKARLRLMDSDLSNLQKNLVAPDKMDTLLQNILKRNKRLQLISLKSFPVVNLFDVAKTSDSAANASASAIEAATNTVSTANQVLPSSSGSKIGTLNTDELSIYKHEVELVLEGNYLDMLAYIKELEAMPEQVYWSRGSLNVLEYPKASLSLQIFTLSLEKKWLNL